MNDQVDTAEMTASEANEAAQRAADERDLADMAAQGHQADADTDSEDEGDVEINLPDMSYDNLEKVKEAVIAKQREQRGKEKAADLNTVKALVGKHGLKWSDIKPEKPTSKVAPKYRNPATGDVWSGRGKPPVWIRDFEDRSQFLIG